MLLHPSVASHGSTCLGAQVRWGAPYPGTPQYKELGVNGRRDCVPCAELWERSALAPSEGLPFPLANINHSRQCVWQEALVFVGFSFFFSAGTSQARTASWCPTALVLTAQESRASVCLAQPWAGSWGGDSNGIWEAKTFNP